MSDFIQGDSFDRIGGDGEQLVWNMVKRGLRKRELLGYSRYPLFSNIGQKRKEPDILLLDKELGVIIIEVKSFRIEDIEHIQPNSWSIKNYFDRVCNPIAQSEDYLYAIKSRFDMDRNIRGKITGRNFVALPRITRDEWEERGFNKKIDQMYILFKDDLSRTQLLDKIYNQDPLIQGSVLNYETFRIAKSILGHETNFTKEVDYFKKDGTKGRIYSCVKNKLYELDLQQENIAKSIAPGPQRIRGIAGSGKTILLCQKAAIMHLRNPDWRIAIVFFSQSLYDSIVKTIDSFLRTFSNGEVSYEETSNLEVLHAWGRKEKNGLYKTIVDENDCYFRTVTDVKEEHNGKFIEFNNSINYISQQLLDECNGELQEIYDAILIDEGQDLVGDDEYKYEGKQSFYYMAYKSLKPIRNEEKKIRRLIWAYDELQSLSDKKIPTSEEIFGDKDLVRGRYHGGIYKSEVMKKCYRTPYQVLTVAHAIGMGLFRQEGLLSGYTSKDEWEKIGYEVLEGDFRKIGSEIVIYRDKENSPNPIDDYDESEKVELKIYSSEFDMLNDLANNVEYDIKVQELNPSRDILILNLHEFKKGNDLDSLIGELLNKKGINIYIPSKPEINQYECHWSNSKPHIFWYDDAVTISRVARAKGNEAPMVYVVGLEDVAENEDSIKHRNKLFTAMTRAKCWVKLMGVGNYSLYEEIKKSIESDGTFKFKYTKPKKETNDSLEEEVPLLKYFNLK